MASISNAVCMGTRGAARGIQVLWQMSNTVSSESRTREVITASKKSIDNAVSEVSQVNINHDRVE